MYLKEVRPYFHQCNVYTSFNVFLKENPQPGDGSIGSIHEAVYFI